MADLFLPPMTPIGAEDPEGSSTKDNQRINYYATSREFALQTPLPSQIGLEDGGEDPTLTWVRSLPSPMISFDEFGEASLLFQDNINPVPSNNIASPGPELEGKAVISLRHIVGWRYRHIRNLILFSFGVRSHLKSIAFYHRIQYTGGESSSSQYWSVVGITHSVFVHHRREMYESYSNFLAWRCGIHYSRQCCWGFATKGTLISNYKQRRKGHAIEAKF